jgi:hypothetical protein
MIQGFSKLGLDAGYNSWDVHLQKLLSLVMLSALGCRSGELALSSGYLDESMRWEHIKLELEKGGGNSDWGSLRFNLRLGEPSALATGSDS